MELRLHPDHDHHWWQVQLLEFTVITEMSKFRLSAAGAVNQAVKALAIAKGYLAEEGNNDVLSLVL